MNSTLNYLEIGLMLIYIQINMKIFLKEINQIKILLCPGLNNDFSCWLMKAKTELE
jgi:hypothetical protein